MYTNLYVYKSLRYVLVFNMILQEHVLKGLCDFVGGSHSCKVTTLPSLVDMGIEVVHM